jgi:hypothetical protein
VRVGVVLAVLLLVVAPARAGIPGHYWSVGKVLRRIDGISLRVGARTVRVRSATTLCSGEGRAVRVRRVRMWRSFVCTYTTFTRRGIGPDLEFRVVVRTATSFRVTDVHWVEGSL